MAEALKDAPSDRPRRLLFQDEGRFGRINDTRRCWAPLPVRPVVGHQIVREYLYGFVAVSPFDGGCTSLILPWVDTQTMTLFLLSPQTPSRGTLPALRKAAGRPYITR